MIRYPFMIGLLLFTATLMSSCEKDLTSIGPDEIDYGAIQTIEYSVHVQPLLKTYAAALQEAGIYPPGLQMDSWDHLILGWERGEAVIPFDANNSLLVELATKLTYPNRPDSIQSAFLIRWINEGARNDAGEVPFANARNRLYVCSQGEAIVNIIDADNLVVIRNVDLTTYGLPRSAKPHHIAFSSDKNFWFVSCIDNSVNKVLKFNVSDNSLVGQFSTPIPALLDHHPSDNALYVSRFMDLVNPINAIASVNTETMSGTDGGDGTILLPPSLYIPHAMRISHDGRYIYSASFSQDAFLVVNHASASFEDVLFLNNDRTPLQIAVTPDDRKAYVSCIGTGEIVVIDVSDPNNRFEETSVMLGGSPWHGIFHPDGSKFYVGNLVLNQLHVINTSDYTLQHFGAGDGSDGLADLHGIEIHPNGARLFLSGRNTSGHYVPHYNLGDNNRVGTVVVVNTASNRIEKVIEVENFASGMRMLSN